MEIIYNGREKHYNEKNSVITGKPKVGRVEVSVMSSLKSVGCFFLF